MIMVIVVSVITSVAMAVGVAHMHSNDAKTRQRGIFSALIAVWGVLLGIMYILAMGSG